MNEKVKKEILDFIRQKTGAASAYVLISTSSYPCEQEKSGIGCMGHLSTDCHYGIDKDYLPGLLHETAEDLWTQLEDEEDGLTKSGI